MNKTVKTFNVVSFLVLVLSACSSEHSNEGSLNDSGGVKTLLIERPNEEYGKYDSVAMFFIYEKNGLTKTFSTSELNLIDSTWKFVSKFDTVYKNQYR